MSTLTVMKNKHDLDEELKRLALNAQRHPSRSFARRQALSKLFHLIMQSSHRLSCPPAFGFTQELLKEIQMLAYQNLFCYICEHIECYDPQHGDVLQWANFLLKRRFFGLAMQEVMGFTKQGNPKRVPLTTISDYSQLDNPSLSQQLIQYLEEDPGKLFEKTHIAKNPAANFKVVSLKRLAGYSWKELASELNVEIPTLSSFYNRSLKKFSAHFKQELMQ